MPFYAQHVRNARNHLRKSSEVMKEIVRTVGPFTAKTNRDRFVAIARLILKQQVVDERVELTLDTLADLVLPNPFSAKALIGLAPESFEAARISVPLANALLEWSNAVEDQRVDLAAMTALSDSEVVEVLRNEAGVDAHVAQQFLMFTLARLDVLPTEDVALRHAIQKAWHLPGLPGDEKLQQISNEWKPYRTIASWYVSQFARLEPGSTTARI